MIKKYKKIKEFVAEQNRLMRTRGLSKKHPEGKLEPCDMVMTPEEKKFWENEDKKYQDTLNYFHK